MKSKAVSGMMLTLLFIGMLTLAFNVQPVKASGTICIKPDGSIDPPTANITTIDNVTYYFTDNIYDSIRIERDNIVVDGAGYTLQGTGSGTGIYLARYMGASNVTIKNIEIKAFDRGIYLYESSSNTISGNNITNNGYGIELNSFSDKKPSYNIISGNNIENNDDGIYFSSTSNNTISGNYITANNDDGIELRHSSNNTISRNNIANNRDGIHFSFSSRNTISGNNITDNSWGIYFWPALTHNTISGNNIKGSITGIVFSESLSNTISGNNITSNGKGISVVSSSNDNIISGNNITANSDYGIYLERSSRNTISGNNITNNGYGIELNLFSNYNSISGNNIENSYWAVWLSLSSDNTLSGNVMNNNTYNFGVIGAEFSHFMHSIDVSNLVNGKPVYYLINQTDLVISPATHPQVGYLALINCVNATVEGSTLTNNGQGVLLAYTSNSTITNNNITNNDDGIKLYLSSDNSISGNTITNNGDGIHLRYSSSNSVVGNNITDNGAGIYFYRSSDNIVYHNNFVDNTKQAYYYKSTTVWDNGYPSGGNYWSDHTDVDLYCGPNQDIWGSDGIWDHPYVIDANNRDNYPLMNPYVPGNLTCSIYTDRTTYHAGETMHLGLNVANPDSVKYVCFAIWVKLPSGSIYVYMHKHSILLPIGTAYSNPSFESITLPTIPSGIFTWHAAFLDRATHTIITEDTAEWEFV